MSTTEVVNTFGKNIAETFGRDKMSLGVNNMSGEQSFADFVRERIGDKSHRDVARKAGVSPTTIGNYLLDRLPNLGDTDLIDRLAFTFDCLPEDIEHIVLAEKRRRAKDAAMRTLQREQPTNAVVAIELGLRGVDNIPDEGKRQIVEFAKQMEEFYKTKE